MFTNKFFPVLILGGILLMHALISGYKLDQMEYPHDNKHSIAVPKKLKRFVFLNRTECMRSAFILEISGYIEFFLMFIVAIIYAVSKDSIKKDDIDLLFTVLLSANTLWLLFFAIYYRIWSKFFKKKR